MASSFTGILLDVSGSMRRNIGRGIDEKGGPWARSIFEVIDNLIKHDISSDNHVFAIGFGASSGDSVFDVIGTLQQIQNQEAPKEEPATRDHINKIFDILEGAGAGTIRKWAEVEVVRMVLLDYMAVLLLRKFETDRSFLETFVQDFLPPACRDWSTSVQGRGNPLSSFFGIGINLAQSALTSVVTQFRKATFDDIKDVLDKAKPHLLKTNEVAVKKVGVDSIFNVQNASDVLHGFVDKGELSEARSQELLRSVEPYIYGGTPFYQSIEKATKIFEENASTFSNHKKLLFVLSDGEPTDGKATDGERINHALSRLTTAGVTVVSCFVTESTEIDPRRLYSEERPDWNPGATFLFRLSSKLPTQSIPRTMFVKRGWFIEITNNETRLFLQVNHPDNMREACEVARNVVCRQDALSDLLASVDLDVYINQGFKGYKAKQKQEGGTCYANASATVLHLSMRRILGRQRGYPDFYELRKEFVNHFGSKAANTLLVLQKMCPKYRLHCKQVDLMGAMKAITSSRPVVARFRLTDQEWHSFRNFFKSNKTGILTKKEIDITARPPNTRTSGHAVVLTSFNSECLRLLNSWGDRWAYMGFFRVQNAEVLGLEFIDVFWTEDDLTEEEKAYYEKHGSDVAGRLMGLLRSLQQAEYTCPKCAMASPVMKFTGTLLRATCPRCGEQFSTNDASAGNILALNIYLTSLSR